MRCLVTGAAGWTGSACVGNLLEAGHSVVAHDLESSWRADAARGAENRWAVGVELFNGQSLERLSGDLLCASDVKAAMNGCDAVVHVAVMHSGGGVAGGDEEASMVFRVQIQGLYNVLQAAARPPSKRVVHVSSCWTSHPSVPFFDGSTRRPDWSLYACSKRLQEELCQQWHDAHGLPVVLLRPDHIVDARMGQGGAPQGALKIKSALNSAAVLDTQGRTGWVCRHDLADACRLAVEGTTPGCIYLSTVGQTPLGSPPPEDTCNVAQTRELLGWRPKGNLEVWRAGSTSKL
jgi:nucleoside-diphosphate-sugar epimerase